MILIPIFIKNKKEAVLICGTASFFITEPMEK